MFLFSLNKFSIADQQFIIEFYGFRRPTAWRAMFIYFEFIDIVFMLRCQNRISRDFPISVMCAFASSCAIGLRVIVIFVEYDFICRCHYAVSVAIYVCYCYSRWLHLLILFQCAQCKLCFPSCCCCCCFFCVVISIQMLHLPKSWKSDLPNKLSLRRAIDDDIRITFEHHTHTCIHRMRFIRLIIDFMCLW